MNVYHKPLIKTFFESFFERTRLAVCIGLVFALSACGSHPVAPVATPDKVLLNPATGYYRVQAGDSLYAIAWRFGLDYKDLAHWNNLTHQGVIHPGQRLALNGTLRPAIKVKPAPKQARKPIKKTVKKPIAKVSKAKPTERKLKKKKAVKPPTSFSKGKPQWQWPLKKARKTRRKASSEHIKFFGQKGQSVLAAAAGQVVYVGSGLRGYGKLIIIKHNKNYLSAYGNNQRLLVREGQRVRRGDKIATMGQSSLGKAMLHFEIRLNGKPVNPLRYLPKS